MSILPAMVASWSVQTTFDALIVQASRAPAVPGTVFGDLTLANTAAKCAEGRVWFGAGTLIASLYAPDWGSGGQNATLGNRHERRFGS